MQLDEIQTRLCPPFEFVCDIQDQLGLNSQDYVSFCHRSVMHFVEKLVTNATWQI